MKSVEEIREHIGADSLAYLSIDDMVASTGQSADRYCMACFNGDYAIEIPEAVRRGKMALEKPAC